MAQTDNKGWKKLDDETAQNGAEERNQLSVRLSRAMSQSLPGAMAAFSPMAKPANEEQQTPQKTAQVANTGVPDTKPEPTMMQPPTPPQPSRSPRDSSFWDEFSDSEDELADEEEPDFCGQLELLQGSFMQGWKSYHCELIKDTLYCFKPANQGGTMEIKLQDAELVPTRRGSRAFCFSVNTQMMKNPLFFSTANQESQAAWLIKLLNAKKAALIESMPELPPEKQHLLDSRPTTRGSSTSSTSPPTPYPTTSPQQASPPSTPQRMEHKSSDGPAPDGQLVFSKNLAPMKRKVTLNDFKLLSVLGRGAYGKVLKVKKTFGNGEVYAMKAMRKTHIIQRDMVCKTRAEREILQQIRHPFIVKLHYAFQSTTRLYLILDLLSGGDLFFHIKAEKRLPLDRARLYTAQLVLALECVHEHDVVYRDLKPENVVLDSQGNACLTDFGMAKVGLKQSNPAGKTFSHCGTPEYAAPELINGEGHTTAVDWWALGCMVFEMLTGGQAFYGPKGNPMMLFEAILKREPSIPSWFTPTAKEFVLDLLKKDPKQRLTDPKKIKAHPFFATINWDDVYHKRVTPGFVPMCDPSTDKYTDPLYRGETPMLTPDANSLNILEKNDPRVTHFEGFSYAKSATMSNSANSPQHHLLRQQALSGSPTGRRAGRQSCHNSPLL
eukprot:TRINITY_DN68145_c10_g3_i3.p1 TRINITY_DN68145_c10_g3~~TRINITY_DN68145_c10_g3_i3.p1  ORF type:complete len:665 (+),score=89.14 TRINITY_DN68145_c10_g3_i3:110-2104(+)